jgi:LPS export ABC transporter protein LptC
MINPIFLKLNIKPFGFLTAFFAITFLIGACENDIQEVNSLTTKNNLPADQATDFELIYSDSGKIKMKLTAPISERFTGEKPYLEFKKGVLVIFFDSLMKEESRISAQYAIQKETENIIEGRNNVEIVNQKGEKLNTEQLFWNKNTKMIYTEKFVKITTKDEIIMGNGMEADQHFRKYKIKTVTGTINIKEQQDSIPTQKTTT